MSAHNNGIGTPPPRDPFADFHDALVELGRAIERELIIPAIDLVFTPLAKFCLRRWR